MSHKPLRNPGQSVNEALHDLYYNKAMPYFIYITVLILFVWHEWATWYLNALFSPQAYTIISIPLIAFCIYRLYKIHGKAKQLKQGRDGEKIVGQYLDQHLRGKGYQVFHDVVVGTRFNIDHVVVCEHGVFAIETKTYSKSTSGKSEIVYQGRSIIICYHNKRYHNRTIIHQAQTEAKSLEGLLFSLTDKKIKVKPVVVFPGWWVESSQGDMKYMWVLNHKRLGKFIANRPKVLSKQEQESITDGLAKYIQSNQHSHV